MFREGAQQPNQEQRVLEIDPWNLARTIYRTQEYLSDYVLDLESSLDEKDEQIRKLEMQLADERKQRSDITMKYAWEMEEKQQEIDDLKTTNRIFLQSVKKQALIEEKEKKVMVVKTLENTVVVQEKSTPEPKTVPEKRAKTTVEKTTEEKAPVDPRKKMDERPKLQSSQSSSRVVASSSSSRRSQSNRDERKPYFRVESYGNRSWNEQYRSQEGTNQEMEDAEEPSAQDYHHPGSRILEAVGPDQEDARIKHMLRNDKRFDGEKILISPLRPNTKQIRSKSTREEEDNQRQIHHSGSSKSARNDSYDGRDQSPPRRRHRSVRDLRAASIQEPLTAMDDENVRPPRNRSPKRTPFDVAADQALGFAPNDSKKRAFKDLRLSQYLFDVTSRSKHIPQLVRPLPTTETGLFVDVSDRVRKESRFWKTLYEDLAHEQKRQIELGMIEIKTRK
uniref:Trichohyalin-like n=1 Tax=Caenorhabditis tropicalis TaxID=1561998 RepID=A0A1I7V3B3_9PELO